MRKILLSVMILILVSAGASYCAGRSDIYGEIKDGLYTNKTLGAEAYFGENWRILSGSEIESIMGSASSKSSTLKDIGPQTPSFYAASKDGSANINIVITNMGVMGRAVTPARTKEFVDQVLDNMAGTLEKIFSEMGAANFKSERIEADFLGSKNYGIYFVSEFVSEVNGVKMYQKEIILPRGEYAYMVTATSLFFDITDDLLSMFHEIQDFRH